MSEGSIPYPLVDLPIRELTRVYPFTAEYEPVIEMQGAGKQRWVCWQNRDDLTVIAVCTDGSQDARIIDQGWTYLQAVRKIADLVADAIEFGTFQRPPQAVRRHQPSAAANH